MRTRMETSISSSDRSSVRTRGAVIGSLRNQGVMRLPAQRQTAVKAIAAARIRLDDRKAVVGWRSSDKPGPFVGCDRLQTGEDWAIRLRRPAALRGYALSCKAE